MEIAIISGKGGTGKSTITSVFASSRRNIVLADCDVDAANMYLIFNPQITDEQIYVSGHTARIDYSRCTNCGLCIDYCNFDAISLINNRVEISEISCDGCKLCSRICPVEAIEMIANDKSRMYVADFRYGKMVYGRLAPGEENSGKLVNMVRNNAKALMQHNQMDTIIIDGPPGIGCPVLSTITGVDKIVIVTEPSLSAFHDLKRTIEVTKEYRAAKWVIVNKFDLNPSLTQDIENYCIGNNITFAGKIPFDKKMVEAMINCMSITEYAPESQFSINIKNIINNIL